ncbi:MAG: hypothetical protein A4E67_00057 [Syntrophaceae bacterium PtaB.Bin038]|nr:MAG: hypothetical protein A4E67_00057 [Syntrophaceae bacterium PtaB.Bin038]
MTLPLAMTRSPAFTSSPASRMSRPGFAATKIFTLPPSASVSSTLMTASVPSGRGAPVMIRMACPFRMGCVATEPAGRSSRTSRTTGLALLAKAVSAAMTA